MADAIDGDKVYGLLYALYCVFVRGIINYTGYNLMNDCSLLVVMFVLKMS